MSLANLHSIIFRVLNDPNYDAPKLAELEWLELDGNEKILGDAIRELAAFNTDGIDIYDPGQEYSLDNIVAYDGNIWQYINPIPNTGVTPGTDSASWKLSSSGILSHQRNKDQYLDLGGDNEVSAEEIRALLTSGTVSIPVFAPLTAKTGTTSSGIPGKGKIVWNANQFSGNPTHLFVSLSDSFGSYYFDKAIEFVAGDFIYLHTESYGIFQRYLITNVEYNSETDPLDDWIDYTVVRQVNGIVFDDDDVVNLIFKGAGNLSLYQLVSEKGNANGYAGLDGTGKIPSSQLPSYVDDIIEVANYAALPGTGETGKIYITIDTNKEYRWSGSVYVELVASPGTTDAVPEGSTNLYFTTARLLATILAGLSFVVSTAITATDSVLIAFGKLQAQITANKIKSIPFTATGDALTYTFSIAHGLSGTPTYYDVQSISSDSFGITSISADGTNIYANYSIAPRINGANNISLIATARL